MTEHQNGLLTWRSLNREGCEMGRALERDMDNMGDQLKDIRSKVDRLTWVLAGTALTFGTAALMLALNLMI